MLKYRYVEPNKYSYNEHFIMPPLHQHLLPEVANIFSQINISVIFTHSFKIKSFSNMFICIITYQ